MIRMLALCIALAVSARAQGPAEPRPVVTGQTIDEQGKPLRKTTLTLVALGTNDQGEPLPPYYVTADSQGQFEFYGVPDGSYRLRAERAGYLTTNYGARNTWTAGSLLTLHGGRPITGLTVRLIPQSVISGAVISDETATYMAVYLYQQRYQDGERRWTRVKTVGVDPDGNFSINKLAPGNYRLAAEGRVSQMRVGQQPESYTVTYYPGVTDLGEAENINLRLGQTVSELRLPLRKTPLFAVSGTITRRSSDTPRVAVTLMSAALTSPNSAVATGDTFRIESVSPGSYMLGGQVLGPGATRLAALLPVRVSNGDVSGLAMDLDPSAGIQGSVAGAPAGMKLSVRLAPVGITTSYVAQTDVKPDGAFLIPGSFAGRFRLLIEGLPADAYIKSAKYGKQDALDPVELASASESKFEIALGAGAARISGMLRDESGKPATGTVTLIPDPPQPQRSSLYLSAETDDDGHFLLQGIRPGKYRLYAWEELEPGAQFDPNVIAPFQDRSVVIDVAERDRKEVPVRRISVDDFNAAGKQR